MKSNVHAPWRMANTGLVMLQRSQKFIDHVLALFMAFFAFDGYLYAAQQAGIPVFRFILRVTLVMLPLMLAGCLVMFLFGSDHIPTRLRLQRQSLSIIKSIPELIALDGYALAAIRNRKLLYCGLIGIAVDFLLMLTCKIIERAGKRWKRSITKES